MLERLAWAASAAVGFASLGQEVLWLRVVAFANGNTPRTFSLVLTLFLLGIVLGAWWGKGFCSTDVLRTRIAGSRILALSGVVDIAAPFALIHTDQQILQFLLMGIFILATAGMKAALFPIVHHLGGRLEGGRTGRSVGWVYFFNIVGATLAPLLIGFWWLDLATSQALMLLLGGVCLGTAAWIAPRSFFRSCVVVAGAACVVVVVLAPQQTALIEHLAQAQPGERIAFLRENRHGIVHTVQSAQGEETVYGGNIYDGKINIDLLRNSNRIDRVWILSGMHSAPRRVLVIGLSGGSWTRVLMAFPGVERIDVVEIQPAYLDLVRLRPSVSALLGDPRVHIHIDDGRRWLRRHANEKFDLIVMNTTFHWRAYATNLLSREFMELARSRLYPGGVLAFNTTGSPDALATAAAVFPHAYRWADTNFVYACDRDWRDGDSDFAARRLRAVFSALPPGEADEETVSRVIERLQTRAWITAFDESRSVGRPLTVITDQNMLTEYRYWRPPGW